MAWHFALCAARSKKKRPDKSPLLCSFMVHSGIGESAIAGYPHLYVCVLSRKVKTVYNKKCCCFFKLLFELARNMMRIFQRVLKKCVKFFLFTLFHEISGSLENKKMKNKKITFWYFIKHKVAFVFYAKSKYIQIICRDMEARQCLGYIYIGLKIILRQRHSDLV